MTKPDKLTEAQERLLISLPQTGVEESKTAQKLLALGLAVWAGPGNLAHTEAGLRRSKAIREEKATP
ncbi:MAG: hypothetical protein O9972_39785 [Burkholderiales bacterium]|nr:hypothetical protein [Burkholderiales bacterium]